MGDRWCWRLLQFLLLLYLLLLWSSDRTFGTKEFLSPTDSEIVLAEPLTEKRGDLRGEFDGDCRMGLEEGIQFFPGNTPEHASLRDVDIGTGGAGIEDADFTK